jgi:hypothetical protein
MKILQLLMFLLIVHTAKSQVLVTFQLPPSGVAQKSQLWNIVLTNTSNTNQLVHLEMMITDAHNGQQVMSGVTKVFTISPGTMQANATILGPIQYNILSTAYYIDPGPAGLLPVGNFDVCLSTLQHITDAVNRIGEECQELIIEPLSPPQLQNPFDMAAIETKNPLFSWLPPMPALLFTNLRYDLELVELYANQSAADGMQQNIPIFRQSGIATNSFPYPPSAPTLSIDKQYAWRILASSNNNLVATSETWTFSIKNYTKANIINMNDLPFVKMRKEDVGDFAIVSNVIKFDYTNETADTIWNIMLSDLSVTDPHPVAMPMDSIRLRPGQNLINYPLNAQLVLVDKHFYVMEITNSRQEKWRLRFEFRKPE